MNQSIRAPISYLSPDENNPQTLIFPKSSGKDTLRPVQISETVVIRDLRHGKIKFSLDKNGFEHVQYKTKVRDLYDNDIVKKYYYYETAEFLKKHLEAEKVLVFDHNQRSKKRADAGEIGMRYPVASAHVDYTHKSGAVRARKILSDFNENKYAEHRMAIVNVWRPIIGPVVDMPLAMCDGETVNDEDLVETSIKHFSEKHVEVPEHAGSIYSLKFNPSHAWFYYSDMQSSDVLLLKNWHSAGGIGVFNSPHTGFVNPISDYIGSKRESIEIRSLVIYPK